MQIYKSPGGARYVVINGFVYCKPVEGVVFLSSMSVERFLALIAGGLLTFEKLIPPILLKKH